MKMLNIILLCILSAVCYGIIHDQITARICVEYFTIGHPPVFPTASPTLLGLGWGVIATWCVGLIVGVPLALAAQYGSLPKRRKVEAFDCGNILAATASKETTASRFDPKEAA